MSDLNLFETPDLILTVPLVPNDHGSARVGTAMVGEIDVEIGTFVDKNAEGQDSLR